MTSATAHRKSAGGAISVTLRPGGKTLACGPLRIWRSGYGEWTVEYAHGRAVALLHDGGRVEAAADADLAVLAGPGGRTEGGTEAPRVRDAADVPGARGPTLGDVMEPVVSIGQGDGRVDLYPADLGMKEGSDAPAAAGA